MVCEPEGCICQGYCEVLELAMLGFARMTLSGVSVIAPSSLSVMTRNGKAEFLWYTGLVWARDFAIDDRRCELRYRIDGDWKSVSESTMAVLRLSPSGSLVCLRRPRPVRGQA